jgi:glutamate formiminotransferase
VSEGRRPEVVARLVDAVAQPGVQVLDVTSDEDHNRSVFTLAGSADALIAGLMRLFAQAVETIDLRLHTGVHPRIGAVDVVPFVPLEGSTMEEAQAAALRLAPLVAERFALPVYLYEQAALGEAPHRRSLPDIRRGNFEGFASKIALPEWRPDFGPARVHPSAGATVIGARFFLIAFNILLAAPDATVARQIARTLRESSGGLPAIRAIGVWLASRQRAQVSVNVLDYRRTSPLTVLESVRREASRHGVDVVGSELIGLMPEAAALAAVGEALLVPDFGGGRIVERRVAVTRSSR